MQKHNPLAPKTCKRRDKSIAESDLKGEVESFQQPIILGGGVVVGIEVQL